jgi:hypothetical protein
VRADNESIDRRRGFLSRQDLVLETFLATRLWVTILYAKEGFSGDIGEKDVKSIGFQ